MKNLVILESRDPFESKDTDFVKTLVLEVTRGGGTATVFLVQNGVLATRRSARSSYLSQLAEAGAKIMIDIFAMHERAISKDEIHSFLELSDLDRMIDLLMQPDTKAIWH